MKIVDTNIFIDHLRNHKPATNWLEKNTNELAFSAITETELLCGNSNNHKESRELLMQLLSKHTKIIIDNPLAEIAGDIARKYQISTPDSIIAASALCHNAELVTKNVKDFKKIPKLRVISPY